jgi:hypothetical protein
MVEQSEMNEEVPKTPKKRGRKPKNVDKVEKPVEKIPKKRGRKPKVKVEDDNIPKIPKKRGRKPKDSYLSKANTTVIDTSSVKDTILHLKINSNSLDNGMLIDNIYDYNPNINTPSPYDPNNNNLELISEDNESENNNSEQNVPEFKIDNPSTKIVETLENKNTEDLYEEKINMLNNRYQETSSTSFLPNTSIKKKNITPIMIYYNEYNKRKEWPKVSNIKCFWCCHNFDNIPCALPFSYSENTFYVFGNFCSPECAAAYNFESGADDKDIWERYALLNHLYSLIYDVPDLTIKLAPPKLSLKIFGGTLSIEEFRECNTDYLKNYKIVLPPMVSIIPSLEEIKKDTLRKKDSYYVPIDKERIKKVHNDLRLKRNKPISNRNTLENCMRLKYVSS